jgi:hypothetical protein
MFFRGNEQGELFGLFYSSLNKRVSIVSKRLVEEKKFKDEFDRLNAIIEMWPQFLFEIGEEVFELEKVGGVASQQDEVGVGLK